MTTGEHVKPKVIYLWRKFAGQRWIDIYESALNERVDNRVATITRPAHKRVLLEVACESGQQARDLVNEFGGRIEKMSGNRLKRLARDQDGKPLEIGRRLVILNVEGTSASRIRTGRTQSRRRGPSYLLIPAGAAFGTGEHATTAMSLRLLEQITREWKPGWAMVDLGTGTGILAMAAKCLGAKHVLAIDNDPIAISTAKQNAQLNKIDNIDFKVGDIRRRKFLRKIDLMMANLFSELLIEILPRLKQARWLILSGILRDQENELRRGLHRNKMSIVTVRRRGKWIAIAATLN